MGGLTIGDVVSNIKEKDLEAIATAIKKLNALTEEYSKNNSTVDYDSLELLKRRFNGELLYFTNLYGTIRKFKGVNHAYFEDAIKRVKSEAIDLMLHSIDEVTGAKYNVTSAERKVYSHPYYTERLELISRLKQSFEKADALHSYYQGVLQSLIQSVSVAAKEFNNQKAMGSGG